MKYIYIYTSILILQKNKNYFRKIFKKNKKTELKFIIIFITFYSNKKCIITYNRQTFRELFKVIYELTRESKEKKMDKENHRVNKANCNPIKNQNEARDLVFKGDEIRNCE